MVAIRLRNDIHDLQMPVRRSRTREDASIGVEVSVGESDCFECMIAAMIDGPSHRQECGAGPVPRDAAKHAHPGGWPLSERGRNIVMEIRMVMYRTV